MEADEEDRPRAVRLDGESLAVVAVQDAWRIDDEWWRPQPVSRLYWQLELEGGRLVTVYRDLVSGRWARQGYK